jgi:hypothetical protein
MEVGVCERKLIGRRREEKGDNEDDTAPAVARGAAHMSSAARAARCPICMFTKRDRYRFSSGCIGASLCY